MNVKTVIRKLSAHMCDCKSVVRNFELAIFLFLSFASITYVC
jgi:hypothetical protein